MASKSERKKAELLRKRFSYASNNQTELFTNFARYQQLYQSKISDTVDYPWKNKLFNPYVFSVLRSMLARLVGQVPQVTLQATSEKSRPYAKANQALLDWEFDDPTFFYNLILSVYNTLLYGKGFVTTGWKYEKAVQIEDENGKRKTVRQLQNKAVISVPKPTDIFIANQNRPVIEEQPWVIERWWPTVGELKAINDALGYDRYKNLDKLKKLGKSTMQQDYGYQLDYQDWNDDPDGKVLEVLRMWNQIDGTVFEGIKDTDDFLIREEDNPFDHGRIPIIDQPCFPEANNFWNMGVVQPIEDLQMALNSVLNNFLDSSDIELNSMWVVSTGANIPDWELVTRPNGIIHSPQVDQIKKIEQGNPNQIAAPMMNEMKGDIQRSIGMADFLQMGTPMPGVRGAAAMQAMTQQLDQNLQFLVLILEERLIRRIAEDFLPLNVQYITEEQEIDIAGKNGPSYIKVDPKEVSAEFRVRPVPNSSKPRNMLIRQQNLESFIKIASEQQQVKIDLAPVFEELIQTMGITDLDQVIPRDMDEAMEENDLLKSGKKPEVEFNDNHAQHITAHQYLLLSEDLPKETVIRVIEHIQDHEKWKQAEDPNTYRQMLAKATGVQPEQPTVPITPPSQGQPQQPQQGGGMPEVPNATNEETIARQTGQALSQPTSSLQLPAQLSGPAPAGLPG